MKYRFTTFLALFSSLCTNVYSQKIGLNFDGSNDYVQTTYSGISGASARTVEAWIRTTANCVPSNSGVQQVIADYGAASTGARFTLNLLWGNAPRIEIQGMGLSGQTVVNDGIWHHVAAVYDPTANLNYSLYVDGVLDTAGNLTTNINTSNSINFRIGMRVDNINNFTGDIDEVRFYNFAKTQSQIIADMNKELCGTLPSGLVAYYKLNEGTPNSSNNFKKTAKDYTSSGNNGTLTNFGLSGTSSNWITGPKLSGGNSDSTLTIFDCNSYTSKQNNTYGFSGTYTETISNYAGCDSIITYKITIGRKYNSLNIVACDSFISYKGIKVKQTSTVRDTFFGGTSKGCDSIVIMNVKILNSVKTQENKTACDSFKIGNTTYYNSQIITLNNKAKNGCDSIHTINLTVYKTTATLDTVSACNSYLSPKGKWHYQSGIYIDTFKNANGCDSLLYINLTIHEPDSLSFNVTTCDSFVSQKGTVYKQTGVFIEKFKNKHGCDSTNRFNIVIHYSKKTNFNLSACDSALVHGVWQLQSGNYSKTFTTYNGCDSISTTNLNLTKIDPSITQNNESLTANESGASYQWITCPSNTVIVGATNALYTATKNGAYAVVIYKNNCTDTSACVQVNTLGIHASQIVDYLSAFPNPNNGKFTIQSYYDANYTVIDRLGKQLSKGNINQGDNTIEMMHLEAGIYYLIITNQDTKRVIPFQVIK